jgi:SAM-dependent methyltransferase
MGTLRLGGYEMNNKSDAMPAMDEAFWDERYGSAHRVWSGNPNPQLLAEATDLTPGTALDVGAGEGADTIWLAKRGWQVTAADLSSIALARGREHADEAGAEIAQMITWLHADLGKWEPPAAGFDLVTLQFFHLPSTIRVPIYERLASAVADEGVLLIVGHHPSDLETTARRMPTADPLFTPEQMVDELGDGWKILVAESRPREAVDPEGEAITIHDSVIVAQRTGSA